MKEIPAYSIASIKSTNHEAKDFDFQRFEYFATDIEHLRSPHRHEFYTFLLVTGGTGSHKIDFRIYSLRPNRVFLIAPGQVHAWDRLKNVKGFVLLFTDSYVALSKGRKLMSAWPLFRPKQKPFFDLNEKEVRQWSRDLILIEKELQRADDFTNDAIFYSIGKLLVRASRLYRSQVRSPNTGDDLLIAFQGLIEKHFLRIKTPARYARMMHITPNHLNLTCKQKSGMAAGELIRQRVVLEAKRLLAHTELTVAEISYTLGFEDNSYFGRYFKKYTGKTPIDFRTKQQ